MRMIQILEKSTEQFEQNMFEKLSRVKNRIK